MTRRSVILIEGIEDLDGGSGYRGMREVKKLTTILLLTMSTSVGATELPQYEVSGFPITPVQAMVLQPTNRMQEVTPTFAPKERTAVMIVHGNGRVYIIKFRFATPSEKAVLGRVQATQSVLFVDGCEPLNDHFED